jgi:glycosyltransferase involved in cell wall biosynthesis
LGVIEHFWCAPYVKLLRQCTDKVVLDLHNIESVLHACCALSEPWPQSVAHRRFARIAARMEKESLANFDMVLTASDSDRRRVLDICPATRVEVIPNTLPETPEPDEPEEHVIAFSGNLEYHPNITALRFFRDKVWPLLRQTDPKLRWRVIGKNEQRVRGWLDGDGRIELTGPVEDAVRTLARAKVVIVPLLSGSGTRIKILEAWAACRAVVSTRLGAEGLPAEDRINIRLIDEPTVMADTIRELLADPEARRRLGRGGRQTFERSGTWPEAWRALRRMAPIDGPVTLTSPGSRCDNGV